MVRKVLLLTLLLAFFLSACRPTGQEIEPTPTAFPVAIPIQRVTTAAPIPITLENLVANPDFYVGATLHLTGQFHRLPLLSCPGESFPSPATWGLEADGFFANASGMDSQFRSLLEEDQLITVEGRWLKSEEPVGCEPNLVDQTIWYLSTDRVLAPHPLVRSLTNPVDEAPGPTAIVELPEATLEQEVQIEQATVTVMAPAASNATTIPTLTPMMAATTQLFTATASITPIPLASAVGDTATATVSADQTPTVEAGGSSTATPDGSATGTPESSVTPSSSAPVDKGNGNMVPDVLAISSLGAGTTDRWKLDLLAGDIITITVAPAATADIVFSVLDSAGVPLVSDQNLASAGEVETIKGLQINNPGIYDLLIRTEQGTPTDYALMFMDEVSYSFFFRGILPVNSTRSDTSAADTDHYWFFNAQSGESVSIRINPESGKNPFFELYDPGGALMLEIDDTEEGEVESLESHTLPAAGMYGILVGEYGFLPMSYTIDLTKP